MVSSHFSELCTVFMCININIGVITKGEGRTKAPQKCQTFPGLEKLNDSRSSEGK